ncbi:hypothetical protein D3C85_1295980 [compost metagenome]
MAGVGDQRRLPGLGPRQVDEGEIGDQQRRVVHAGLDRRKNLRVTGQGVARHDDDFTVDRVLIGTAGREAGDLVTDCKIVDTLAHGHDHARHLVSDTGRQACL